MFQIMQELGQLVWEMVRSLSGCMYVADMLYYNGG